MGPEKLTKLFKFSLTIYINDVTRGPRDTSLATGEFIVDILRAWGTGVEMGHREREKRQGVCPLLSIGACLITPTAM